MKESEQSLQRCLAKRIWQRAIMPFQKCKLTNNSPSPDTEKKTNSKFKKSFYSLVHLNIQDNKMQYKQKPSHNRKHWGYKVSRS